MNPSTILWIVVFTLALSAHSSVAPAQTIGLVCRGTFREYQPKQFESNVPPGATRVDLDRKRISTPMGDFVISKVEETKIWIDDENRGLVVFGSLDRLSGHMTIFWQHPSERAKSKAGLTATVLAVATGAFAQPKSIDPSDIDVVDGDTITVFKIQPNVRLVGFNAPETDRARCLQERELGFRAKDRLRALVRAGNLTFEYVDCSCSAGTQGKFACNYGRDCGTLKFKGHDAHTLSCHGQLPAELGTRRSARAWRCMIEVVSDQCFRKVGLSVNVFHAPVFVEAAWRRT